MTEVFLVTGGAGFIGSHVTERLLKEGARVRVLDNFSTGGSKFMPFAENFPNALEIIRGDVCVTSPRSSGRRKGSA